MSAKPQNSNLLLIYLFITDHVTYSQSDALMILWFEESQVGSCCSTMVIITIATLFAKPVTDTVEVQLCGTAVPKQTTEWGICVGRNKLVKIYTRNVQGISIKGRKTGHFGKVLLYYIRRSTDQRADWPSLLKSSTRELVLIAVQCIHGSTTSLCCWKGKRKGKYTSGYRVE